MPPNDVAKCEIVHAMQCETCGFTWRRYNDGPFQCPQCVPGQPRPFAERRADAREFLGPEWFWNDTAGSRGMWDRTDNYVHVPREQFEYALSRLPVDVFEPGASILPQIVDKLVEALARVAELEAAR